MALATAYSHTTPKRAVNTLIISHFDAHGVAFAAARARVLMQRGEDVEVISKFPETGPQGLSTGSIKNLLEDIAPQRIEIIDIPIDVRNPDAAIKTLADLAMVAPVYYYDHHETDVPFVQRLHQNGVFASVFGDNVAMAAALGLLEDEEAKKLAIIGMVADRDRSVLKLVPREEVERIYLPLANALDVIVRNPRLVGANTQGDIAKLLAEQGASAIPATVEYPPERLARELTSSIVAEGTVALIVDWSSQQPQHSMWTPKTLEQIMLLRGKPLVVAIVPGYNPRTRTVEGYDVRVLRYWLAPPDVPSPEEVAKDMIAQKAIHGNVVGHGEGYVSIRFSSLEEARRAAEAIFKTIEGMQPTTAHLVSDKYVAEAVRRDFQAILQRLTEILEAQKRMYEEYLELKRRQVELLERTQRHEYD